MSAGNAAVVMLLVTAVFFAVRRIVRNRGNGCGGNCEGCSFHDDCGHSGL